MVLGRSFRGLLRSIEHISVGRLANTDPNFQDDNFEDLSIKASHQKKQKPTIYLIYIQQVDHCFIGIICNSVGIATILLVWQIA